MPHTVLIVDDEEGMLTILNIILGRAGFHILTATNGYDALDLILEHNPSVVVLDDMMPGITGGEVCKQVKANPKTRLIPIVMHSAGMQVKDDRYIAEIGADAALSKPVSPGKMVDTVRQFLVQGV